MDILRSVKYILGDFKQFQNANLAISLKLMNEIIGPTSPQVAGRQGGGQGGARGGSRAGGQGGGPGGGLGGLLGGIARGTNKNRKKREHQ